MLTHLRSPKLRDRGSVLLLIPAAVLVLVILGAIAVDSAVVFLGQRELSNGADAAANDAATALSDASFYQAGGTIVIDPRQALAVVQASLAARDMTGVTLDGPPVVTVARDGTQVCVALSGTVDRIFGPAIPGVARAVHVHARAAATAVRDSDTGPIAPASLCP